MIRIPFIKVEGCGNDYVRAEAATVEAEGVDPAELARRISLRHTGVGSDGLILVEAAGAGIRMHMYNADGSRGELCLNGLRGVALAAVREDPQLPLEFTVSTDAGDLPVHVESRDAESAVGVKLLPYEAGPATAYPFGEEQRTGRPVNVGNPHVVFLMDTVAEVESVDLRAVGEPLQSHADFPEGVNVHVAAWDGDRVRVRHWERGSGATRACGSGAVATGIVAREQGTTSYPVAIAMPGGAVRLYESQGDLWLEGSAREVFRGTFEYRF